MDTFAVWLGGVDPANENVDPIELKRHGCIPAFLGSTKETPKQSVSKLGTGRKKEQIYPSKHSDADTGGGTSPPRYPAEGRMLHDMAMKHMNRDERAEALALFVRMVDVNRDKYGHLHPTIGVGMHNIGVVYTRSGNYIEAEKAFREAVTNRRLVLGIDHRDVADSQVKLGTVLLHLQKFDAGLSSYLDALRIMRKDGGHYNSRVAEILSRIGFLYFQVGELLASQASFEDSIDIYRSISSDEAQVNYAFAETLCNIGSIQVKKKKFSSAIASFEEAFCVSLYMASLLSLKSFDETILSNYPDKKYCCLYML